MNTGANRGRVRRVGIVFSGGPAPGANAVIAAAAYSFMEDKREVVGFFHGYSHLMEYHPVSRRLVPDEHYRLLTQGDVSDLRNARGVLIGTSRAHPGAGITCPEDLANPEKTQRLQNVYAALIDLGIDALISIGGDGTLATASYLHHWQENLPPDAKRIAIVHVPKTIDNDYSGIDFTFGFFTAVDVLTKELMNLRADAIATGSYFIVETMGRKAGWLAYGVAIAGEANLVVAPEDVDDTLSENGFLSLDKLANRIVDTMIARDRRGKHYGTVVLAEGLVGLLSPDDLSAMERDKFGHVSHGGFAIGKMTAERVMELYEHRSGYKKKVRGLQIGYESRSAPPHAFDVMLGSQLGIGAYRALVEEGLDGHMVSVRGQLDLHYVPFAELVDDQTLRVAVRLIEPKSDFHRLARFLETRVDHVEGADTIYPGRRPEHG